MFIEKDGKEVRASFFKGAGTPEVITPHSCPHLIDHIFGARITLILLFAVLFFGLELPDTIAYKRTEDFVDFNFTFLFIH